MFESDLTIAFLNHWRGLRREAALPASEDYLDNMDIRIAPMILLFECVAGDITVRMQGTRIVERWGVDRTGESWLASKAAADRAAILANMTDCVNHRCGVWAKSDYFTTLGSPAKLESLTLPLAVREGRPKRLVTLSNVNRVMDDRDGVKTHVAKSALGWFDVGLGVPGHALRTHPTLLGGGTR
jgi:hypothetical protein